MQKAILEIITLMKLLPEMKVMKLCVRVRTCVPEGFLGVLQ